MKINKDIKFINEIFNKHNKKIYIVGGAVRDYLMGVSPNDYDLLTDASIEDVIDIICKHNIPFNSINIAYGIVEITVNMNKYELSSFKSQNNSLYEDLMQRDFTINSLAYDINADNIIDYFEGVNDIENKILRFTGDRKSQYELTIARTRIDEDKIRSLRAIRFELQLGFSMDEAIKKYVKGRLALEYNEISDIRVKRELEKILKCDMTRQEAMQLICMLSITYIPEMLDIINCDQHNKYHKYNLLEHTADVFVQSRLSKEDREDVILYWSALLHDIGKLYCETIGSDGYSHYYGHQSISAEMASRILKRLMYNDKVIHSITQLVELHDYIPYSGRKKTKLRRFVGDMGEEQLNRWFKIKKADILSHTNAEDSMKLYNEIMTEAEEIKKDGTAITIKDLKITGDDLINLGIGQSHLIGKVLEELRTDCLGTPDINNREWLLKNALAKYKCIVRRENKQKEKEIRERKNER